MTLCLHERTEVRARPTISGLTQWAHQCVDCGTRVGNWVKKPEHDAPAWDMAAEEAAAMRRPNTRPDENAERLAKEWSWRRVYEQFIRSREWQHMRSLVMRRAKNTCEACLEHEAEQVHHTRYPSGDVTMKDFVEQPLWELRAICWRCHANRHPHMLEDVA